MLYERLNANVVALVESASLGADYACCDGGVESERIAHGQYPFAHFELVGAAECYGFEVFRLYFDEGDVGVCVGANYGGVELSVVVQRDFEFLRAVDYVIIGDYVAVATDDYARAQS